MSEPPPNVGRHPPMASDFRPLRRQRIPGPPSGLRPGRNPQGGERARVSLADQPVRYHGRDIPVTLSLGATVYHGPAAPEVNGLLRAADTALYRAKKAGRNCVRFGRPAN